MKRAVLRVKDDGTFRLELILRGRIQIIEGVEEVEIEDRDGKMLLTSDGYHVFIDEVAMQEKRLILN